MRGLMVKDLILLRNQLKTCLLLLGCGIFMAVAYERTTVIFYLAFMAAMVVAGTISYDEFDNGFSFLFTLPVTRKTYVRQKYLLSLVWSTGCLLLGGLISLLLQCIAVSGDAQGYLQQLLSSMGAALAVIMIYIALVLPLRIGFNSEKAKTVQFLVIAAIAAGAYAIAKLGRTIRPDIGNRFIHAMQDWKETTVWVVLLTGSAVLLLLSERLSERIIQKKEY